MIVAQIAVTAFGFPDPKTFLAAGSSAIPAYVTSEEFVMRMTVMSTMVTAYYLLILPIGIGFLSHAYRHFFEAVTPAL